MVSGFGDTVAPSTDAVTENSAGVTVELRDVSTVTSHTPGVGALAVRVMTPPVWYPVVFGSSNGRPYGWNRSMRTRPTMPVTSTASAVAVVPTLMKKVDLSGRSALPAAVIEKLFEAFSCAAATTVFRTW